MVFISIESMDYVRSPHLTKHPPHHNTQQSVPPVIEQSIAMIDNHYGII